MQLIPYIIFNGNCEQALKFYENALGGTTGQINRYSDMPPGTPSMGMSGDKIMHTDFKVDGNVLFLASDGPSQDKDSGMVSLSLNFTDAGSIQSTFSKMSDGGNVTMPLQDTFWGATFGMLVDQFGVKWMFNYDKPKK
jgi:PhnB protein